MFEKIFSILIKKEKNTTSKFYKNNVLPVIRSGEISFLNTSYVYEKSSMATLLDYELENFN